MALSARALVVAIVVAAAPWSHSVTAQAPSAFLMGQVVDAASGTAIAGAAVTLSGSRQPTPRLLTNAEGQFLFRSLAAGRYQISATAGGYVAGGYGQMRPGGLSQSIELSADDEKRGDLRIRLWKQASITGRIVDESGDPVAGCTVRFFRRSIVNGTPRFDLFGPMRGYSDDRGIYRISELVPGDYLVGVTSTQVTMPASLAAAYLELATSGNGVNSSDLGRDLISSGAPQTAIFKHRVGDFVFQSGTLGDDPSAPPPSSDGKIVVYPSVFYSSASVPSQASVIKLASGEDRTGIDLQLKLTPTVRVSGIVTGPDGPARNLGVKLLPAGSDEFRQEIGLETASTATDANGAFTFLGVTPGQYTLKALRVPRADAYDFASSTRPPLPDAPTLWATMPVNVGNADVSGLTVALSSGSRVSGRLVFEGTSPAPTQSQLVRVSIQIAPLSGVRSNPISDAYKRIEPDGRFTSVGLPQGKYTITASIPASGGVNWRFKSATLAGRDISDEGFALEAADVSGLVITFADRGTDVSGTVRNSAGKPDDAASVVVLPADSQMWKQGFVSPRRVRSVRTSTTGAFTLSDLPAGSYFIAAIRDEELDNWQETRALEAIVRVAAQFTLADGQKVAQNLTTRSIK